MNVVDSSAWLAYFADEPAADFFSQAIEDTELLIVPSVCLYEVFKVILREKNEDQAFLAIAAMQQGRVVDLDADLAIEAAAIGHEEKLALADSIIFAVAQKHSVSGGMKLIFFGRFEIHGLLAVFLGGYSSNSSPKMFFLIGWIFFPQSPG